MPHTRLLMFGTSVAGALPALALALASATARADGDATPDAPTRYLLCPPEGPPLGIYDGEPRISDTIFVNFDGAEMKSGQDHAPSNTTQISNCARSLSPYGAGAKRDAAYQALVSHYEPFAIRLTDTRPDADSYCMVVATATSVFGNGVLGISPMDCGDQNPDNVSFAFVSESDQLSAPMHAATMAHELAHAFGLDHVNDTGDVMNPWIVETPMVFKDDCVPIAGTYYCSAEHQQYCPSAQQNDYQELMGLFGPAEPDTAPPIVEITHPNDGDTFEIGTDLTITVEASDDQAVAQIDLYVDGTLQSSDDAEPWGWDITNMQEGGYSFYATAMDAAGNEATSDTVSIHVGATDPGDDGGSGDGGDGHGDGGDAPHEPGDGDEDLPSGDGDADDEEGCGCRAPAGAKPAWLAVLMGLPWLLRRRATAPNVGVRCPAPVNDLPELSPRLLQLIELARTQLEPPPGLEERGLKRLLAALSVSPDGSDRDTSDHTKGN
jgi:hypothetical protein